MKVIFLDFDGVLNSAASFLVEDKIRKKHKRKKMCKVQETLCHVCTSNFQYLLDKVPDAKIVISSTWREIYELDWLKDKLAEYGIDSSRVIDITPSSFSGPRGREIFMWLEEHKEVDKFVILDDHHIGYGYTEENIVKTTWLAGLNLHHVSSAMKILGVEEKDEDLPLG